MVRKNTIEVQGTQITVASFGQGEYISLTDMTRAFDDGGRLIENWLQNKNTVEFLGIWERMHNPDFDTLEFDRIMRHVGLNRYKLSARKWVEFTKARGVTVKSGKYSGIYAHQDIAYHFGMWLSPEFNLLVVREFQRMRDEESQQLKSAEWLHNRFLTKINYKLQAEAIRECILPGRNLSRDEESDVYSQEAEMLNTAVFGYGSREWAERYPQLAAKGKGIRDYATTAELIALNNAQAVNKELIRVGFTLEERLEILRRSVQDTLRALAYQPVPEKIPAQSAAKVIAE